jgi:hypothetical protein
MRDLVCFFDQQLIDSLNSCVLALMDSPDGVGALAALVQHRSQCACRYDYRFNVYAAQRSSIWNGLAVWVSVGLERTSRRACPGD